MADHERSLPSSDKPGSAIGPSASPAQANVDALDNCFEHLTDRELFERLGWFIKIRWVAGGVALLLILIGEYGFAVHIPPKPVILTIFVLFLYNAFFLLLVTDAYRRQRVSRRFIIGTANAQIVCDFLTLAALIHFTGGIENYFIFFFICPVIIASELLTALNAFVHAVLGALLMNAVAWGEYFRLLPHVPVGSGAGAETYSNWIAVTEHTVALSLLLFATAFLGSTIASRMRSREDELQNAHRKLQELEQSKSYLMRKTSHELRAPLNAIVTMLKTIDAGMLDWHDPRALQLVHRSVERAVALNQLIGELHRYAILRDAKEAIRKERVQLDAVVEENVRLFRPVADEKQIRITCQTEPVSASADQRAMEEVVVNLISNAIQYTPAGGQVDVRLFCNGSDARLEVRDTGIGIPASAIGSIFEEFYRAPNAKQAFRKGTGMGLPIVQRIAEAHGGRVDVESKVGTGTTFTVVIPTFVQPLHPRPHDPS